MFEAEKSKDLSCIVPKGFLRAYILEILEGCPMHGYALIEKIHELTGFWKPSTGTIYPLLNSLVKEGYIEIIPGPGRRKVYKLSKKGKRFSSELEKTRYLINEKISGVLSRMTPATKAELKAHFRSAAKNCRKGPMIYPMHRMCAILLQLSSSPEKTLKASEILEVANSRLEKLLKSEGGGL